jgi:hypothetical protein
VNTGIFALLILFVTTQTKRETKREEKYGNFRAIDFVCDNTNKKRKEKQKENEYATTIAFQLERMAGTRLGREAGL